MSVLEGWAAGAPAILTRECNLPEGFTGGAAMECSYDAKSIALALTQALALDNASWLGMAQRARHLAAERFSPEVVALQWATAYDALWSGHSLKNETV